MQDSETLMAFYDGTIATMAAGVRNLAADLRPAAGESVEANAMLDALHRDAQEVAERALAPVWSRLVTAGTLSDAEVFAYQAMENLRAELRRLAQSVRVLAQIQPAGSC